LKSSLVCVIILVLTVTSPAQISSDVLGSHDLSPGSLAPGVKGAMGGSCQYCHAPHSGIGSTTVQIPLWSQKLSNQAYTNFYASSTNKTTQPTPGLDSSLCLSCHDGTVAPGTLQPYGQVPMSPAPGTLNSADVIGPSLQSVHPFSFSLPINNASDLVPSLSATPPKTADITGAVRLIRGNVECTSCHNAHVQNIDPNSSFLVINNSGSALCQACHSTVPSGSGMGMAATAHAAQSGIANLVAGKAVVKRVNPLEQWTTSAHAVAPNKVIRRTATSGSSRVVNATSNQASLGSYATVAQNGCLSCHKSHNAQSAKSLLRGTDDQACLICHNGSQSISPVAANILAETTSPKISHSTTLANNVHSVNEDLLLNQNRHATCVDCHNPHASNRVTNFTGTSALRASQNRVMGVSAVDGTTALTPAVNQYENCLRCHGTSTGKQARTGFGYLPISTVSASDPLNIIPQFSTTATSSHPVMHDRNSPYPQPSLRANILKLDGTSQGRSIGARILCTDCHNSDDNREFGGSGPNGPHGSTFPHILERQYVFSQATAPGQLITNLFPTPSLSAAGGSNGGPYALCAKCHDLKQLMSNSSFSEHSRHINDGFSCSACHTAHGMGSSSATVSGERLVNFDSRVVAPLMTAGVALPVSYNRSTNSCALACHNHVHRQAGTGLKKIAVSK